MIDRLMLRHDVLNAVQARTIFNYVECRTVIDDYVRVEFCGASASVYIDSVYVVKLLDADLVNGITVRAAIFREAQGWFPNGAFFDTVANLFVIINGL